jgi:Gluconate 2-dehydrogenase subunit 3
MPVANAGVEQRQKLSRREIVQRLLGGMAAGAGLPLLASSHPIYQLLADDSTLARAEGLRRAVDWKPLFLSTEQNATLVAVSEVVAPGSTSAKVSPFIDLLLSVDTAEHQREFTAALATIDDEAKQRFGRTFAGLAQSEQVALLTDFSAGGGHPKEFHNLKQWIVGAYYSSEQGMRELGWNGNYAFESYPGCQHGEQH